MFAIKKEKDEMRALYREKRAMLDKEEKARRDGAVCRAAVSLASYRYAKYVLMYAPTDDEIDVMPIAADALARGKKVAFPRCHPDERTMDYHIITSLDDLSSGAFGLREPDESLPVFDDAGGASSVCFVPGLVYDNKGYRLGYGKGYYDRYLSSFKGNIVGIVYNDFVVPEVPRGRFDISIKILLTDKGLVFTGEN
ncbi:MAG: 5-formyltetrahydrofolate cyclo-ligase [Clostridia bacterium]|nr:5-formyltetrahydrofolate cyclo-ligase [Clostridia bacterium]